ncbi:dihydroxyacetone kinase subunit DhaL [uncultured Selenomonas sp.]|uniref:dihydroxyacetone kinase subunit DhaL n=1 Tax=uncultured Selenomonas sp. TaxID=159275 RepID=UPI0028DC500D|nr:dihydroxyacetone kinase subunit DhaL [uncultured Selenomonas sp.]
MDKNKRKEIVQAVSEKIEAEKDLLTELDSAIGDGDHGINMARGAKAVMEKLPSLIEKDTGTLLKGIGMAIVSSVGGASGPLYGTAFMKAGDALKGKEEPSAEDFLAAFSAAIAGIKMRGKSTTGEKTMLDALCPAESAMREAIEAKKSPKEILQAAAAAAEKGAEETTNILATKGRASYLGERSIGHRDPGAVSSAFMLRAMADAI